MIARWPRCRCAVVIVALCNAYCSVTFADNQGETDRFDISNDGDALLVPIQMGGKSWMFAIDTGSTHTGIDRTLLTGQPIKEIQAKTTTGATTVAVFKVPDAQLGIHKLQDHISVVGGIDLTEIRRRTGLAIYGLIGMDFLQDRILEVNFDRRELKLFTNLARPEGLIPVDIELSSLGPTVQCVVPGCGKADFVIDTGLISHDSGSIKPHLADELARNGDLETLSISKSQSLVETSRTQVFKLKCFFVLSGYMTGNAIFAESKDRANRLSLHYLARYNLVFDFPNRKMFLTESKVFDGPDECCLGGLRVSRQGAQTAIDSVEPLGPAAKAGIHSGDILVSVLARPVDHFRMYELEHIFSQENSKINAVVERGKKRLNVDIQLTPQTETEQ